MADFRETFFASRPLYFRWKSVAHSHQSEGLHYDRQRWPNAGGRFDYAGRGSLTISGRLVLIPATIAA